MRDTRGAVGGFLILSLLSCNQSPERTPGQGLADRLRASNSTEKAIACIQTRDAPNAPQLIEAIPALVEALSDKEAAGNCSQALTKVGPAAVPALAQALNDRREVYWALSTIARIPSQKSRDALPRVLEFLKDSDSQIRWSAIGAAAVFVQANRVEPEAVVPALADVLQHDGDGDIRGQAAFALGEIGSPQAVLALRRAARDKDKSVRGDVKEALMKATGAPGQAENQ